MIKKIEKLLLKYFWPPSASFGKFLGKVSKPRTAATEKTKLYWTIRFRIDAMMSSRSFKEEIEKRKSKLHFGKTKVVLMNITLMKTNWGVERKKEKEMTRRKRNMRNSSFLQKRCLIKAAWKGFFPREQKCTTVFRGRYSSEQPHLCMPVGGGGAPEEREARERGKEGGWVVNLGHEVGKTKLKTTCGLSVIIHPYRARQSKASGVSPQPPWSRVPCNCLVSVESGTMWLSF